MSTRALNEKPDCLPYLVAARLFVFSELVLGEFHAPEHLDRKTDGVTCKLRRAWNQIGSPNRL